MTDIEVIRGDDEIYDLAFTDADGDPVDLTGAGIVFTAKRRIQDEDADAVLQYDETNGITVTDALGGIAELEIAGDDTSVLEDKKVVLRYDLEVTLAAGTVRTPLLGKMIVRPDVTNGGP
jgi:hypothetical protein